jgi:hypothetical protein
MPSAMRASAARPVTAAIGIAGDWSLAVILRSPRCFPCPRETCRALRPRATGRHKAVAPPTDMVQTSREK